MDYFAYKNNQLFVEDVAIKQLVEQYGSPLYIYSYHTITRHIEVFKQAFAGFKGLVCYAVKANSNIAILQLLAQNGAGFDIVSAGELARVIAAGGDPKKVVYSGVAKSVQDIEFALNADIMCFNVESKAELLRINQVAQRLGKIAPISLRVNPNVDPQTHPYISTGLKENKFGIPIEEALDVYLLAKNELANTKIVGVDFHIGSQITKVNPYIDALKEVKKLIWQLHNHDIKLHHLDIGGGLGVIYTKEAPPLPKELLEAAFAELADVFEVYPELEIIIEPGRSIMANAGVLATTVEYTKSNGDKNFAIVDAGMNDLIRPSLYNAYMNIINADLNENFEAKIYDVVGPVCETGDFLGKDRELQLHEGSILVVRGAGAYGSTMSSHYNTRPKITELMIEGDKVHVIRQRETFEDIFRKEQLLLLYKQ